VEPDRSAANRPELSAKHRAKERQQMEIARPVHESRPGDDGREAVPRPLPDGELGVRLARLVRVRRPARRGLVRRAVAGRSEHAGRAAVDEPLERRLLFAAGEEQLRALDVRRVVLDRRYAGLEEPAGEVVDQGGAVGHRSDRRAVGDLADDDLRATILQRLRLRGRAGEHPHAGAIHEEPMNEPRAQEPGRAGDYDRHAACGFAEPTRARARERATPDATFVTVGACVSMFV
jgi:hypothetical protein